MDDFMRRLNSPRTKQLVVRWILALILIPIVAFVAIHWLSCMQLAPIERAFTRGC